MMPVITCTTTQTIQTTATYQTSSMHPSTRTSTANTSSCQSQPLPSSSATLTSTTSSTSTLQRTLGLADVSGMVDALISELLDSGLFNHHAVMLSTWQRAMHQNYLRNLTTPEGLKKATLALCALLHKVIRPLLRANRTNTAFLIQVGVFEKKCMAILKLTCPDDTLRQYLIKSYPIFARQRLAEKEKITKVLEAYALLEEELTQMKRLTLESLLEIFEELKLELSELNAHQTAYVEAIKQQLQALTTKIAQISESLSTHASASALVETELRAYKQSLLSAVREMRTIVQRSVA